MIETNTFNSVWDAIADTPEQAANLQARAELMQQITIIIKANDQKQADAAAYQRSVAWTCVAFFTGCFGEHSGGFRSTCTYRVECGLIDIYFFNGY